MDKLEIKDNVVGESRANNTHYTIGKNIRETIIKNGGTLPENLPRPNKSLKELEKNKEMFLKQCSDSRIIMRKLRISKNNNTLYFFRHFL